MKKVVMVFMFIFISSVCVAKDESITIHGGVLHTQNSNYGDSISSVIRVETVLIKDLNIGVEYGYHGPTSHEPNYGDMSGHSVLGDLIYYPPVKIANFRTYVLGGLGWSWWNFDRSSDLEYKGIQVDMGDSLAKKVGLGGDYAINEHWSINLEWNYFQSHVPKESYYESTGSFANVVTDEKTIGQEETNIMVGLKYRF